MFSLGLNKGPLFIPILYGFMLALGACWPLGLPWLAGPSKALKIDIKKALAFEAKGLGAWGLMSLYVGLLGPCLAPIIKGL